jgi:hypothetical protein
LSGDVERTFATVTFLLRAKLYKDG